MTEREEALEPCPFCGGEASRQDLTDDDNAGGSCIACDRCGASSPVHFDRQENLYDSWNRRASSPPPKGGEADALAANEMATWARVLPHPQAGNSDLRYLYSLALMRRAAPDGKATPPDEMGASAASHNPFRPPPERGIVRGCGGNAVRWPSERG